MRARQCRLRARTRIYQRAGVLAAALAEGAWERCLLPLQQGGGPTNARNGCQQHALRILGRLWVMFFFVDFMTDDKTSSLGVLQNIDKEFLRLWFREHCDPYNDPVSS